MEAIRYYFNGYTLTKIASAQFIYDDQGKLQARRCIIKVNEFSPTPAKEYLSLPAGVKDATKSLRKMKVRTDEKEFKSISFYNGYSGFQQYSNINRFC